MRRACSITTRLRTTAADAAVLNAVGEHLGRLRRADLAATCHPQPLPAGLGRDALRRVWCERLNRRKRGLTASSSARWANAIIWASDERYRLAREAQHRHIIGRRAVMANRASRPRFLGTATGRCDTHATGGSRCESYQPGRARWPAGDPIAATDQGHGEPNPVSPAGQEHGYRAGQPLPRQRPTTANSVSNGIQVSGWCSTVSWCPAT